MRLNCHHTKTVDARPLVLIEGLPGIGAELTPTQLRHLARLLITIANDADQGARGPAMYGLEVAV